MADQIHEQPGPYVVPESLHVKQLPDIEQVSRVLAVEGRRHLAAEEFCV
jgi:hypothetical protein